MKKFIAAMAAIAASTSMLMADRITLSDGSVINGQVKSIAGGKAVIATEFAGEITVDQDKIARMATDAVVSATDATGKHYSGAIGSENANAISLGVNEINYLWTEGMEDPTLPKGRQWSGDIAIDIAGKTGNTEKFNGGAAAQANLTGPNDKLHLGASATYERENGKLNTKKYLAGIDYEQKIVESSSTWYIRTEYEKQPTSGLRRRLEAALGYGFYAIDKEHTKLRLRAGVSIRERKFTDDTKTTDSAGEAGLHFEQDIDEWGKLVSDLTYQPSFKDFNDYRLLHESALDIPLLLSKPISLRLGVSNEYNNRVPEGTKRLDTTYFAKLVYKWK